MLGAQRKAFGGGDSRSDPPPRRYARRTLPRLPRQEANPLLGVEEIRPLLLDHDAAEYVPEESDVPPKPGVGAACAHAHILPRESV